MLKQELFIDFKPFSSPFILFLAFPLVACGGGGWGGKKNNKPELSIIRVSVDGSGLETNDESVNSATLPADNRFIVFESEATNLIDDDTNNLEISS